MHWTCSLPRSQGQLTIARGWSAQSRQGRALLLHLPRRRFRIAHVRSARARTVPLSNRRGPFPVTLRQSVRVACRKHSMTLVVGPILTLGAREPSLVQLPRHVCGSRDSAVSPRPVSTWHTETRASRLRMLCLATLCHSQQVCALEAAATGQHGRPMRKDGQSMHVKWEVHDAASIMTSPTLAAC